MIEYTYVVVELGDWWVFEQTNFLICLVLNIWYNQRIQTFVQFNPVDGFQNLGEICLGMIPASASRIYHKHKTCV